METVGLVVALLAIGAVVWYAFSSYSAKDLYTQAQVLMGTKRRIDGVAARKKLDELDATYPDNPYKKETQGWRDKLLLRETEGRAGMLESEANTGFNKPSGVQEERFFHFHRLALIARKRGDDVAAVAEWEKMASGLDLNDKDDRPWHLLAKKRAEDLTREMSERRAQVIELMTLAKKAEDEGKNDVAISLRAEVKERYLKFKDIAEFMGITPDNAPATTLPTLPAEARVDDAPVPVGDRKPD